MTTSFLAIAVLIAIVATAAQAQLSSDFYSITCPQAAQTVSSIIGSKVRKDPTVAAGLLRLQFHDCFVRGCDGSLLLDSVNGSSSEKEGLPNINSVRGYDIVDEVKTALEAICPGVVSCSDIVALASEFSINAIGGPWWNVPLGRRDGFVSLASETLTNLPPPDATYSQLISIFKAKGLTEREMVILSGAHTIGKIRCLFISSRLYNFPGSPDGVDPTLNSTYAAELKQLCKPGDMSTKVPFDPSSGSNKFDSMYYSNIKQAKGIIRSDQNLAINTALVDKYSAGPIMPFFWDFAQAMEKLSKVGILTGTQGEIRRKCNVINSPVSPPSTATPPPRTSFPPPPPTASSPPPLTTPPPPAASPPPSFASPPPPPTASRPPPPPTASPPPSFASPPPPPTASRPPPPPTASPPPSFASPPPPPPQV